MIDPNHSGKDTKSMGLSVQGGPLPEPYATSVTWRNPHGGSWQQWHDREDPMPTVWDDRPPDEVVHVYTADQMQAERTRAHAAGYAAGVAAERERLRAFVEAVRDANAMASRLPTVAQESAWVRLMAALGPGAGVAAGVPATVARQALEALENSIDLVRHDFDNDWRHGTPTRAGQLAAMKKGVEDHESAIAALRAALASPTPPAADPLAWVTSSAAPPSPTPPAEPVPQWRTKGCADWYDGHPDPEDGGGPYETRTLYAAPPQAAEPVSLASIRSDFEAHMRAQGFTPTALTVLPSGTYMSATVHEEWMRTLTHFAPVQAQAAEPTMADAIAAGDGTLHGAIDYWQTRALKAEAAPPAEPAEPVAWQWLDTAHFRKHLPATAEAGTWRPLYAAPPQAAEPAPAKDAP